MVDGRHAWDQSPYESSWPAQVVVWQQGFMRENGRSIGLHDLRSSYGPPIRQTKRYTVLEVSMKFGRKS